MEKYKIFAITLCTALMVSAVASSFYMYFNGAENGYNLGYIKGIQDLARLLETDVSVVYLGNGEYLINITKKGDIYTVLTTKVDLEVLYYQNGVLQSYERHAGNLTANGAKWIRQQTSGVSNTTQGKYISVSNSNSSFDTSWEAIPSEFTSDGWQRATGTYAAGSVSGGSCVWTVTYTFTGMTAPHYGVRRYGLNYCPTDSAHGLIATDVSTARNVMITDSLAVTWTLTQTYTNYP
jgi:hypothetical protein